ncbi:MAG: ECF-type sigma factor [Planctomycetota bacterium]
MNSDPDITTILNAAARGEQRAVDKLLPFVRGQLREVARDMLARERQGHTLQPTALVHEAYLKMIDQTRASWNDREHFLAVASQVIRRILVDHARGKKAIKRGGDAERHEAGDWLIATFEGTVDLLALDDAMALLSTTQPRAARIVEMRFFAGLTIEQTASVLDIGTATVEREWRLARAILYRELSDD